MNDVLIISNTKIEDLDHVISMELDKSNSEYIIPNTKKEHLELMERKDIDHLILRLKNGKVIGFVILAGLANPNRSIELRRIVIREKGRGYGRKAIKEINHYCFHNLKSNSIWLDVLESNKRAQYLYLSEGFKKESVLLDHIIKDGEHLNLIIMSMTESDYKNKSV